MFLPAGSRPSRWPSQSTSSAVTDPRSDAAAQGATQAQPSSGDATVPDVQRAGAADPALRELAMADEPHAPAPAAPESRPAAAEEPEAHPPAPRMLRHLLVAWIGAFVVIGGTWRLFAAQDLVFAFASLGGSAVILFGMPASPMAQPRSLFGGHAIASVVGLVFLGWFGTNTWSIAAAMATALVAMQLTRTIHSPAGADPIIIMTSAVSGHMVMLNLSVGLALLWLVAVLMLNGLGIEPYCRGAHLRLLRLFGRSTRGLRDALSRRRAGG